MSSGDYSLLWEAEEWELASSLGVYPVGFLFFFFFLVLLNELYAWKRKRIFSSWNDVLTISAVLMTSFCAKKDMDRASQVSY